MTGTNDDILRLPAHEPGGPGVWSVASPGILVPVSSGAMLPLCAVRVESAYSAAARQPYLCPPGKIATEGLSLGVPTSALSVQLAKLTGPEWNGAAMTLRLEIRQANPPAAERAVTLDYAIGAGDWKETAPGLLAQVTGPLCQQWEIHGRFEPPAAAVITDPIRVVLQFNLAIGVPGTLQVVLGANATAVP